MHLRVRDDLAHRQIGTHTSGHHDVATASGEGTASGRQACCVLAREGHNGVHLSLRNVEHDVVTARPRHCKVGRVDRQPHAAPEPIVLHSSRWKAPVDKLGVGALGASRRRGQEAGVLRPREARAKQAAAVGDPHDGALVAARPKVQHDGVGAEGRIPSDGRRHTSSVFATSGG